MRERAHGRFWPLCHFTDPRGASSNEAENERRVASFYYREEDREREREKDQRRVVAIKETA